MTGPDRIWAWPTLTTALTSIHADDEDLDTYGLVEYTRRDPSVLAALPEVQELIRQAVEAEREACADVLHDDQVQIWADEIMYDLNHAEVLNIRDYDDKITAVEYVRAALRNIAAAIRKRGDG